MFAALGYPGGWTARRAAVVLGVTTVCIVGATQPSSARADFGLAVEDVPAVVNEGGTFEPVYRATGAAGKTVAFRVYFDRPSCPTARPAEDSSRGYYGPGRAVLRLFDYHQTGGNELGTYIICGYVGRTEDGPFDEVKLLHTYALVAPRAAARPCARSFEAYVRKGRDRVSFRCRGVSGRVRFRFRQATKERYASATVRNGRVSVVSPRKLTTGTWTMALLQRGQTIGLDEFRVVPRNFKVR